MGKKRTPEQREAMKFAYWNKWCPGGDPNKVKRTKGIEPSPWDTEKKDYESITNVMEITFSPLDKTLRSEI